MYISKKITFGKCKKCITRMIFPGEKSKKHAGMENFWQDKNFFFFRYNSIKGI